MARLNAFFAELIPTISRLRLARRLRVLTQTGSPARLLSVVNQRVRDGPLSSCVRKEQGRYPSATNQSIPAVHWDGLRKAVREG